MQGENEEDKGITATLRNALNHTHTRTKLLVVRSYSQYSATHT